MLMEDDLFPEQLAQQHKRHVFQKTPAVTGNGHIAQIVSPRQEPAQEMKPNTHVPEWL
jgi:hypothetical protein